MPDYGHDLLFGAFLPPAAEVADDTMHLAEVADEVGLDLVSVQDHPYQGRFLDAWTLLTVIAARTANVRVFPNVANLPLRPPAVLARAAASLDRLTNGRFELGIGAGGFVDPTVGMGGPRRTPAESVAALDEAIEVIRGLWTPGRGVKVEGAHYRLRGAHPGPFPVHDIGIWIGAIKPRMLRLTGRVADGWLPSSPYVPPERLAESNRIIDAAAERAGRPPAAVRRLYNIVGSFAGTGAAFLRGSPRTWIEQLAELVVTDGMSAFVLMVDSDGETNLRRFAEEVAPGVRALVEAERSGGGRATPEEVRPAALAGAPRPEPVGPGVTAMPDDGPRLSDERVWDEARRPIGPRAAAGATYSAAERANGQHLVDVHDHLRAELAALRDLVDQVAAGAVDIARARSVISTMTLRQNNWTLGTYCESYCRLVTTHHTLEDRGMFPQLRRADARLAPVIDRLEEEHHAIAGVIERVDRALVALVGAPGGPGLADVRAAVDLLTDSLLSHLSYEERELVEPLSRLRLLG
jgi:alkanesulfonate monooxygenase SsuD/methylene tetrahydromethanopterin reductase-like flavin-dependent oxidoreductase (luciferase family)/hemerythrin-like domain-containing protein